MNPTTPPIAIIGCSGRFPGADSLEEFWSNLVEGRCAITEVPEDRWNAASFYSSDPAETNKGNSKWGGFLKNIDGFDPLFFGISPREASLMDPQQRLLVEEAWQTLENAGYAPERLAKEKCGIFIGVGDGDYLDLIEQQAGLNDGYLLTGNTISTYAGRIAYLLDLHGPCFALDTACSSSLVAIHLACESLRSGKSTMALAGGASAMTTAKAFVIAGKTGLTSPTGQCKAFDASADGYVLGEAVGMVLLKPLDRALADGDHIHAVIRASGINQDGRTNGLMAPNAQAQTALELEVLADAGLSGDDISYVEAMAIGTNIGDAIEINALSAAFRKSTKRRQFCPIGSIKPNIGHSGQPSGVAGLIKLILAMRHGVIPPSLNHQRDNPLAKFEDSPFFVADRAREWNGPRRALINGFGHSGTNACLLIEEPPPRQPAHDMRGPHVLTLSAKTPESLLGRARDLLNALARLAPQVRLADLAWTLNCGRGHFRHRVALLVADFDQLREALEGFVAGRPSDTVCSGVAPVEAPDKPRATSILRSLTELAARRAEPLRATLTGIAQLYAAGFQVDWTTFCAHPDLQRVPLPGYPFARERCWVRARPDTAPGKPKETANVAYFSPRWKGGPLPEVRAGDQHGPILLFVGDSELPREFATRGVEAIVIRAGSEFTRINSAEYWIRPSAPQDYSALLKHVCESHPNLAGALHTWEASAESVSAEMPLGVESVALLAQALIAEGRSSPFTVLRMHRDDSRSLANHCIGGFARALVQEAPSLDCRVIQLPANDTTPSRIANIAISELGFRGTQEVRYEAGARLIRQFEQLTPSARPVVLRTGGTYLITGGLGALGKLFAKRLCSEFKAKVALLGRSAPKPEAMAELTADGGEVIYLQTDINDAGLVREALDQSRYRFGPIHGILHTAGVLDDAMLASKSLESWRAVVRPKTLGTVNLDRTTENDPLDFFVLFSSIASVAGNIGQTDYAAANRFLDAFAVWRDEERRAGRRRGRSVAINWPYWLEGGMRPPAESLELAEQILQLRPLRSTEGWEAFLDALSLEENQVAVISGSSEAILPLLNPSLTRRNIASRVGAASVHGDLAARLESTLIAELAPLLEIEPSRLRPDTHISEFGVDSMLFTQLVLKLNRKLGLKLAPAALFGHPTLRSFASFLAQEHAATLSAVMSSDSTSIPSRGPLSTVQAACAASSAATPGARGTAARESIAVVGMAGRFPGCPNVDEFWELLAEQRDAITEVPVERWDWRACFGDPADSPGKTLSKWGGFISGVEHFDPEFFNISPAEAELIDPHQRLLLQTVWHALEDAGIPPSTLADSRTGVFVAAQPSDYQKLLAGRWDAQAAPGLAHSILANRISYWFNLRGPSETIDTACSSSAVALHRACQALQQRECDQVIVAAVSLMFTPDPGCLLGQMGILSTNGETRTFDESAAGYVRGEGICAVVLKSCAAAVHGKHRIHGSIIASGTNHGGRAASLLAPNPAAQANLIRDVCRRAQVDPATISYLEASGTANPLADAIEIEAFKSAFGPPLDPDRKCGIGCLKPNVGHLEAASGLAALIKILLSFRHNSIPATHRFNRLHPAISLDDSRFFVVDRSLAWPRADTNNPSQFPRRAGIHSFGFGGTNAFLILQDSSSPSFEAQASPRPELIVFSARTAAALRDGAASVLEWLNRPSTQLPELADAAFTLQFGRDAMEHRLAIEASTWEELNSRLQAFHAGNLGSHGIWQGSVEIGQVPPKLDATTCLSDLASHWVTGGLVEFSMFHAGHQRRLVSLPGYAFAAIRCWPAQDPYASSAPAPRSTEASSAAGVDTLDRLRHLFASLLKIPPSQIDPKRKLVSFGADSILLIQAQRRLRRSISDRIDLKMLMQSPTLEALADAIDRLLESSASQQSTTLSNPRVEIDLAHGGLSNGSNGFHHANGSAHGSDETPQVPELQALLTSLPALSDAEVEAWLAKLTPKPVSSSRTTFS